MEFYQFCPEILPILFFFFFHHQEIKQRSRKSTFSNVFLQNVANAILGRLMLMENQEMLLLHF